MARLTPLQLVLLLLTSTCSAQITTLRVQARVVLLDATVTDTKGNPVLGLTAKDFAVYEDRMPQQIVSFEPPAAHQPPTPNVPFDPAHPTAFGSGSVTILTLDELNTHFSDSAFAVDSIKHFLLAEPAVLPQPATLLVVRASRLQQLAPYTLDRDALLRALAAHVPEQAWQLEQSLSAGQGVGDRLDRSVAALEELAQYSARIPGRKNLIWVGGGFPSIDPQELTPVANEALRHILQHLTDTLLEDRVSLYAVDPTSSAAGMTEITDPDQAEFAASAAEGLGRDSDPFDKTLAFDHLGPATGGRVLRGMNDIDRQIAQSIAVGSAYYTLGYRPASTNQAPGDFRRIRIVCLRPGLTATTHEGYYPAAAAPLAATRDTIGDDLNQAATSDLPANAVGITVERGSVGTYILHVQSADLTWSAAGDHQSATAEVLAVSLSAKNRILAHTLHEETASAPAAVNTQDRTQTVRFTATLDPAAKQSHVRFVVRDKRSGRMGTVDLP